MFKGVDAGGKALRCITGHHRAARLKENFSLVVVGIYSVNGDTALCFTGLDNSFVHMTAIHAFSTEIRQQGRVDIDDAVGKSLQYVFRNFPEKTGQNHPFNPMLLKCGYKLSRNVRVGHHGSLHPMTSRHVEHARFGVVGHNQHHLAERMTGEVAANGIGVCTGARSQNGNGLRGFFHGPQR